MSGFKNIGSIINGESCRGRYCSVHSKINFAVSDVSYLNTLDDRNKKFNKGAGVFQETLDQIAIDCEDKTYKICFMGKNLILL